MYQEISTLRNPSAEHLAFAEVIAQEYDEIYSENSHYASKSYMDFEELTLQAHISSILRRQNAVDLGCGTGRLSILLSSLFKNVDAFDISQSMINYSNAKKEKYHIGNINFSQHDLNRGIPVQENSADFIYSAFGLGSFVEDIHFFCKEINRTLSDNGKALISFYNRNALLYELGSLSWTPSLSATLDITGSAIKVQVDGKMYSIFANAFTIKEVENVLGKYFNVISLTTFPTIASILPDEVLNNSKLRNICNTFDLFLANQQLDLGAYIVALFEKKSINVN